MSVNNQFRQRLDVISKVEIVSGCLEITSSNAAILLAGPLTYGQYISVFSGKKYSFVGTSQDGAIIDAFMHDGSARDNGGYGGDAFELTMNDGSHRVLVGPWSSRPSVHSVNSGISFTEVRVNGRLAYFSQAFIAAIVHEFNINATMTVRVDEDGEIYLELVSK
jgi:hypothetical protein